MNNRFCRFHAAFANWFSAPSLISNIVIGFRDSHLQVFCKKGVLKNFVKFTEKHLYQTPYPNKVAGLRPATLLKKRIWHRCFSVNFAIFLRTPFSTEQLRWLLLNVFLKYFAEFKGKYMSQSLFCNKVVGLRPVILLEKKQ